MQMNMMAAILNTDEAINDVVAYINTLEGPSEESNELAVME
jgi:cytochrome c1